MKGRDWISEAYFYFLYMAENVGEEKEFQVSVWLCVCLLINKMLFFWGVSGTTLIPARGVVFCF